MLLQEVAFIQEVLVAIQVQVQVKVQAQVQARVKVLDPEALVILQKVLVQIHLITIARITQIIQAAKTIAQAVVVKQQKEVIFQYLSQYHLVIVAMEEVIMVLV